MECLNKNGSNLLLPQKVSVDMFLLETQSSSSTTTNVHASSSMHTLIEGSNSKPLSLDDAFSSDADISNFLKRKVQIATYTWAVGAHFSQNLTPWSLFLANAAVSNKLQNYQLIKGDLKITFYVNGTPFHAGLMLASYNYLNAGTGLVTIGGDTQLITRSQRPHLFLNVSTNKSGCLCLPFFLPTNYVSLTNPLFSTASIGTLNIDSFAALNQINGGTDSVTITVFAEMINVKLTGPTMSAVSLSGPSDVSFDMFNLEPQSDEYNDSGVISGPASAVANVAGKLQSVPVIGKLALATHIGAGAVSRIARLFGYSKPAQTGDVMPMRNYPVSSLALIEGADTSQKLTMTGKQELSVDPTICELEATDELTLQYLTTKESYVTTFDWDVTDAVDTTLFAMDVDPMVERYAAVPGGTAIIPTSLAFATRPFAVWSGTLKYRFQVIASQYHRGRVAIIYDPTGPLTGDPYNTTFNTIIDLAEGRDFTLDVKWQQDRAYQFVDASSSRTFYTSTTPETRTGLPNYTNGVWYARVVNELVVPDGTSGIKIIVSISAGDDFEVANPKGDNINVSPYAPIAESSPSTLSYDMFDIEPQSSTATEIVPTEENAPEQKSQSIDLTTNVHIMPLEKPLIYYGEKFVSFRQLLKRYTYYRTFSYNSPSAAQCVVRVLWRQMPYAPGFATDGVDVTAATNPYNYVGSSYINYLKRGYAGWRGSVRWKFLPASEQATLSATRATGEPLIQSAVNYVTNYVYHSAIADSNSIMARGYLVPNELFSGGGAVTQNRSQDALEVEIPFATNLRFSKTKGDFALVNTNTLANAYPGGDTFSVVATSAPTTERTVVQSFVAAGEDFTLMGFVGAPVSYYNILPPA